jgi:hypothetical protein
MEHHQDTQSPIRRLALAALRSGSRLILPRCGSRFRRDRFLVPVALLVLAGFGCSDDPVIDDPASPYLSQTSEDNLLHNFQVAWRERRIDEYARLLASDFRYYLDPATRQDLGIEYLDRTADSTLVACLFFGEDVEDITIQLTWPNRSASSAGFAAPRDTWTKLFLSEVFLDVDVMSPGGELTTYRVEDQTQRFFFRRGRTYPPSGPGDTLTYIVEWRDEGAGQLKQSAAGEPTSWSGIKNRIGCPP